MPKVRPRTRTLTQRFLGPKAEQAVFQHPALRAMAETLPTDHPAFINVIVELRLLIEIYKVELTPEIARRVAERALKRFHEQYPIRRRVEPVADGSVVYYMRIGNRVKIGTSTNLKSRMASINPEELMAVEPGGVTLEHDRHNQFRDLHTHGEWFRLEDPLVGHIEQVRAQTKTE